MSASVREWCLVLDARSRLAARSLARSLRELGADVEAEPFDTRVWCFASSEADARALEQSVRETPSAEAALRFASLRVWDDARDRYVSPDNRDEDPESGELWVASDLEPRQIRWRVQLELVSVFDFADVRRRLPALRRPVLRTGNRTLELGASDDNDARAIAHEAMAIEGVAKTSVAEIRPIVRWFIRQRLAGNYASETDDGPGYGYADSFWWGDSGPSGHGGGHGGHNGGGHGGH